MDRLKRFLPFVAYGVFYLFAFFFSFYFTFPYDILRDRIVAEFHAGEKGKTSNQRLEIDTLEPYWFTGVRAKGVRLTIGPAQKPLDPAEETAPTEIEIEDMHARVGIWSRIFGTTKVSFYAKAWSGEVEGAFSDSSAERKVEVELSDIAIGHVDPIVHLVGLPMYGALKGKVDLTFPEKRFSKAEGQISLGITDLAIGDGKAKLKGALALPRMAAGDLGLEVEVTGGAAKITKLAAQGPDLDLAAEGRVTLRDTPSDSAADIYLRFKFTDAYKNRNDITRGLFGTPGSSAPALFELDPKIKSSKRSDGYYGWHMTGTFGNPRFEPYTGAAAGGSPPSGARVPTGVRFPATPK